MCEIVVVQWDAAHGWPSLVIHTPERRHTGDVNRDKRVALSLSDVNRHWKQSAAVKGKNKQTPFSGVSDGHSSCRLFPQSSAALTRSQYSACQLPLYKHSFVFVTSACRIFMYSSVVLCMILKQRLIRMHGGPVATRLRARCQRNLSTCVMHDIYLW